MLSLHHTHIMASDIDATIDYWCALFDAEVVHDVIFSGARNVFLRVGNGRLHLYDQAPKHSGRGAIHHIGIETDNLQKQVSRLRDGGVSVTNIRSFPDASYAMAEAPDGILVEVFELNQDNIPADLRSFFETPSRG